MKHEQIAETKMSHSVLGLDEAEIGPFILRCVKERSLSKLVANLNNDILNGTSTERDSAEKALGRMGFL
ncbi:hypothetical protein [uncultured Roseobacter sp.]|uniref:hypothetical protein n=1 Tax=uncultured Roseobacter sp. TaxID=114847 RepID=UPI00262148DA|nr:hypothetical protein [uncultured Roseobacter sp.]